MSIQLSAYDPAWPQLFEREKERLQSLPALHAVAIEHIGSTAVVGMIAKPVIDIFVGVASLLSPEEYMGILPSPPYGYVDAGMPGRHLFSKYVDGVWTHNIHLVPIDGFCARKEIVLRDFLRTHPAYAEEYSRLKLLCAQNCADDLNGYTRAKTALIQKMYDCAQDEKGLPRSSVWEGDNNPLEQDRESR